MVARYQTTAQEVANNDPALTGSPTSHYNPKAPDPGFTAHFMPRPPSHSVLHEATDTADLVNNIVNGSGHRVDPYSARDTDFVDINGMRTTVGVARQMGLLRRTADGIEAGPVSTQAFYGGETAPQAAKHDNEPAPAPDPAPLSQGAETVLSDIRSKIGTTQITTIVHTLANGGELGPMQVSNFASNLGILPEEAKDILDNLSDAFGDQARRYAASFGVSEDMLGTFLEYAEGTHRNALRDAQVRQALYGDLSGYDRIVQGFKESLGDLDPDAVLNAKFGSGITATRINGRVVLNIPGHGQMSYQSAYRAGLITVG